MSQPCEYEKEKLVIGVLYNEASYLEQALNLLTRQYGKIDSVSKSYSFSDAYTAYYDQEMNGKVSRILLSYARLVDPAELTAIKLFTNKLEEQLSINGSRRVNLDPGLMSHGRFMLATAKNASARIPLSKGIYADLTLFYARDNWNKLPWTYADFQSEYVRQYLCTVRNIYLQQRREAAETNAAD